MLALYLFLEEHSKTALTEILGLCCSLYINFVEKKNYYKHYYQGQTSWSHVD